VRNTLRISAAIILAGFAGGSAVAEDTPFGHHETAPVLGWLQTQQLVITAIGNEGGLSGYYVHRQDGKGQTFYLTPDGNHLIAGIMVETGGLNTTGIQLARMKKMFEDAKDHPASFVSPVDGKPVDSKPAAAPVAPSAGKPAAAGTAAKGTIPPPTPLNQADAPSAKPPAPGATSTADPKAAAQWATATPKNQLIDRMKKVAWFEVASPRAKNAPVIYMVADPQCPYCHAAWRLLRDKIAMGEIAVDVILVNGLPGSEPLAVSILSRPDSGQAWYAGEGSQDGHAIAPGPERGTRQWNDAHALLNVNDAFAREMRVTNTPWLAYVGKDGKVYTKMGADDLESFLAAI
jgi:hypothetical protein